MVQEFHLSITPVRSDEYLVRVEWMEPGVPLAEEQVQWPVDDWLARARQVFTEPLAEFVNRDSSGGIPGIAPTSGLVGGSGDNYEVITLNPVQPPGQSPGSLSSAVNSVVNSGTGVGAGAGAALSPEPALVQLGQELYDALFQGTIRDAWVMAQGVAQNHEQPLRLRLGMKGDRLPRLPWEVLHSANRPLAAVTDIVFSRYHSGFTTVAPAQRHTLSEPPLPPSLQILMVLSAPTDQANLELKREALQLRQELESHRSSDRPNQNPHIEVTLLEQPGREALTQMLEQAHFQVFHFAGHSSPGALGGKLHLVNATTGLTESLNGDDLAGLLVNNGIKLAVFNSCLGAQAATSDEFDLKGERTLAEALIHRGIPSVLAMAERIPDQVALNLSRLFYRNLKFGHSLDVSLCRARQGLISSYGSHQLYWALPILYLQTNFEGRLVRPRTAQEAEAESSSDSPYLPQEAVQPVLSGNDRSPATLSLWTLENDRSQDVAHVLGARRGGDPSSHPSNGLDSNGVEDLALGQSQSAALARDRSASESLPDYPGPLDLETALTLSDSDDQASLDGRRSEQAWNRSPGRKSRSLRSLPMVLGGIAAIVLIGGAGWGIGRLGESRLGEPRLAEEVDTTPGSPKVFRETANNVEEAIKAFEKDQLDEASQGVESLLDEAALQGAETALGVASVEQLTPEILFLRGRLNWQQKSKEPLGEESFDDAYRTWTFAMREDPDPDSDWKYLPYLGFAAYANGKLAKAENHWDAAIAALKGQPDEVAQPLFLLSRAGLALLQQKQALAQPLGEQDSLLNQAMDGYNFVISEDRQSFNPTGLGLNHDTQWIWAEGLVNEWLALSQRANASAE